MFGSTRRELARVRQERDEAMFGLQVAMIAGRSGTTRKPDLSKPITIDPKPMEKFVQDAIRVGLQRLFDQRYFCICDLKSLIESARIIPDGRLMTALAPLHCMNWSDMEPDFRIETQQQILAMFVPVDADTQAVSDDETEEGE